MQRTLKSILCTVLVAAMVFGMMSFVGADNTGIVSSSNNSVRDRLDDEAAVDEHEIVTIMVKLSDKPVLDTVGLDDAVKSQSLSDKLIAKQNKVIELIRKGLTKSSTMEIEYQYTLLFNGFSFRGEYGLIEKIKRMDGVADCYRSSVYELPEEVEAESDGGPTKLTESYGMINADKLWQMGYTGKGQTIAIVDTGIYDQHPCFSITPERPHFDSAASIQEIIDSANLKAEEKYLAAENKQLKGTDVYKSGKIPFEFNYVTGEADASHKTSASEHGTHVSSTAAGNNGTLKGVAYDAQIIAMNVFKNGGAEMATILAALEDCAALKVDAMNMSLGWNCGFTENEKDLEEALRLLTENGTNVVCAAGNSGVAGSFNRLGGENPTYNIDNGVVSKPGASLYALSVAASDRDESHGTSYFSSWGATSDLKIKPEIMGPGEKIYAAADPSINSQHAEYNTKNGTSMASPHIAGATLLLKDYVDENFGTLSERDKTEMIYTLLMSTAIPCKYNTDKSEQANILDRDILNSPRQQGAGQTDLYRAITTKAYLKVDGCTRPKLELGDSDDGKFTLTFKVVNFGDTQLKYKVRTCVMMEDSFEAYINGVPTTCMAEIDVDITKHANVTNQQMVITVPAKGETTVTVNVDVSGYKKEIFDKFPNGNYIEGFVFLDTQDNGGVDLSIPYLGFFGDWEKASVLDREFYFTGLDGNPVSDKYLKAWGVNTAGSAITDKQYVQLGMNPFANTTHFLSDRASISPNNDGYMDKIDTAYNYLLRNCSRFEYSVFDKDTNQKYYEKVVPLAVKNYAGDITGDVVAFGETAEQAPDWDGTYGGKTLDNGKTVIFKMTGYLPTDEFDPDKNENATWELPVTIDTEAPKIVYWNYDSTGVLTVHVQDNHYTAYVGVYSDSGCNSLIQGEAIEENSRGAVSILSFNLGTGRQSVYVRVGDYAYNLSAATNVTKGQSSGSISAVGLDSISFNEKEVSVDNGFTTTVSLDKTPVNANNFEIKWESGNTSIATVSADGMNNVMKATVKGVGDGETTITATATDKTTGKTSKVSVRVKVIHYPTVDEAMNGEGSELKFTSTGSYQWTIDRDTFDGRVAAKSTNQRRHSTSSTISTKVSLKKDQVLGFDYYVSCDTYGDNFIFTVDGEEKLKVFGESDWNTYYFTAPDDGEYSFVWKYEKDEILSDGYDTAWVDNVKVYDTMPSPEYAPGDVDNNGLVEMTDALQTLRCALNITTFTPEQIKAADSDGDGKVTSKDALYVLRMALKIDKQ